MGFRLVKPENYDLTRDNTPEFRCQECSQGKLSELKERDAKCEVVKIIY